MDAGVKKRAKVRTYVLIFLMTFFGEVVYVVWKIYVYYSVWDVGTDVGNGVDCWR